jgi:Na+(H+)/acetate symporter ActP
MATYRSKIGIELVIPLSIFLTWSLINQINTKDWSGLAIIVLASAFFAHLLLTIYYQVDEKNLIVKCSFLINTTINISSIKTIRESGSILASAAASLDRLEIIYNDNDSILISPREKEKFVEHLQCINPNIIFIKKRA